MNDTLLDVDIPRSGQCPHYSGGQFLESHEHIPIKRRKGEPVQRWKCKSCRREIRWESRYSVWVLSFLIEEEPW